MPFTTSFHFLLNSPTATSSASTAAATCCSAVTPSCPAAAEIPLTVSDGNAFTPIPQAMAPKAMTSAYAAVARTPISLETVASEAALIAGPTIRNTNAAPGVRPFATRDAAIGIDAVEQTYMGNPTSTIADIASQSLPPKAVAKKSAGTQTVMTAETARPQAQMGSISLRGVFANPELDA